jgi:voltage-gated potassium channel
VTAKDALATLANYTGPLRRFGASSSARIVVLAVGLAAMTAYTMPELQKVAGLWLEACLWCCLAYFVIESAVRVRIAARNGQVRRYLISPSGFIDLIGIAAVPIALACHVSPPTAWLFASLWVLKLAQDSPALAQIGRVFLVEAKPLAGVLALFLIILFL